MKRDGFGQRIAAQLDGMKPVDDKTSDIKLTRPFALLALALGKAAANVCFIMPEHVAQTDAFTQIKDFTGSGPFKFLTGRMDPRRPGRLCAIRRLRPPAGAAELHRRRQDGLFRPHRVEHHPRLRHRRRRDAVRRGGWWQNPIADLLPILSKAQGVQIAHPDKIGNIMIMRFNSLQPPFNNVKLRQAMLHVVNQKDFMEAAYGDDTSLYRTGIGVFTPGLPGRQHGRDGGDRRPPQP